MDHSTIDVTEYYGEQELRWYQVAAINAVCAYLLEGFLRICINLPTGAGKTVTLAASLSRSDIRKALNVTGNRKLRVLFVAHNHRLLTQGEETFIADSNVEVISQSMFSPITADVMEKGWDVCVLDECHHEGCLTFQYMLNNLGDIPIIGLTATIDRADGCLIKFQKTIAPITREEAVEQGFLAKTKIHSFVDSSKRDKTNIVKDIIENFGSDFGQTMVFMRTKKEVRDINQYLNESGYNSVAILEQSKDEVNTLLNAFSAGQIQFLANCNKINEGVDVKGCTDVLLGRQFGSYPQINQVIGRAARPDSECNVWELINPVSGKNLDTTIIVGTPEQHRLLYKKSSVWNEKSFDYVSHKQGFGSGLQYGLTV